MDRYQESVVRPAKRLIAAIKMAKITQKYLDKLPTKERKQKVSDFKKIVNPASNRK